MRRPQNVTQPLLLSPSDFVAITNQILDHAFGFVQIEGELSNFRISKNRWVYFDVKDDGAKVACFGSVYSLPGPLKDGLMVRISGTPRLNPQFGFSISIQSINPIGEGSIKQAYDLLKAKLTSEGLFELSRKRLLPTVPKKITLITSHESAAYADFIKIINYRWPFVRIELYDVQVQGEKAAKMIAEAIALANNQADLTETLVITRGGGSIDDLAVFNDERVVRAIAGSRIPTLVAIGHEIDESLCELAADKRASTPSNAAELLVPDKSNEVHKIVQTRSHLGSLLKNVVLVEFGELQNTKKALSTALLALYDYLQQDLLSAKQLLKAYDPNRILLRGYSVVTNVGGQLVKSTKQLAINDEVNIRFYDGSVKSSVKAINKEKK